MNLRIAVTLFSLAVSSGCVAPRAFTGNLPPRTDQGVHDSRPGVQSMYPGEFMFVTSSGAKVAFSARELESIAKEYIQTKKVPFEIAGAEMQIWINTSGGKELASVDFGRGIGKQSLRITIDKDGHVLRHEILWSVD